MQDKAKNDIEATKKLFDYIFGYQDCLNIEAIFSDETENFVSPINIEKNQPFEIKIRTWKNNIDKVYLCSGCEKFLMQKINNNESDLFDFYLIKLDGYENKFEYYFEINKGERKYFYNKRGLYDFLSPEYNFNIIPGFIVPDWIKGAIMYQIYVDRFYNGDKKMMY